MDGNKKFRPRALIVRAALRFIMKSHQKSSLTDKYDSSENVSSLSLPLESSSLSHYCQEKYPKRKLSMSKHHRFIAMINCLKTNSYLCDEE